MFPATSLNSASLHSSALSQHSISIGTCAWSYDDWRGVFYPEHLPDSQRLAYYAQHFNAVEIDSSFYHPPSRKTAEHWAEVTPDHFVFTCKLWREITHGQKLRHTEEMLAEFLRSIEPLAPKLGCVLIQLPPYFNVHQDEFAFREFIRHLPTSFRFAVEFRDPDWHLPRIGHLLEEHGVCFAWNDLTPLDHRNEGAFTFQPQTTDFLYIRLMGDLDTKYGPQREGRTYNRLQWPRKASLESWAIKARQHLDLSKRILVLASNHFEGFAPVTCQRIATELGIDLRLPDPQASPPPDPNSPQLDLGI